MIVGTVHHYLPKKTAFEFNGSDTTKHADKIVLFIGGLTDGLLTVHYLPRLAAALDKSGWGLVQGLLTSAYSGWAQSSLEKDNKEMAKLVSYLRSPEGGSRSTIVLMGHSTGCQDTIRYLSKQMLESNDTSIAVDGGIFQAPVSDREGFAMMAPNLDELVKECYDDYISKGLSAQMLPLKFQKVAMNTPITAYRFHSLMLVRGDDDYFSTYITKDELEGSFGKITTPILVLYGDKDEFVPPTVDRQALIDGWKSVVKPGLWYDESKVLANATHTVEDADAVEEMVGIVCRFVKTIE